MKFYETKEDERFTIKEVNDIITTDYYSNV